MMMMMKKPSIRPQGVPPAAPIPPAESPVVGDGGVLLVFDTYRSQSRDISHPGGGGGGGPKALLLMQASVQKTASRGPP